MDNLAPIDVALAIPTKAYVDGKTSSDGFDVSSGRWAPAWPSSKAALIFSIPSYWIYAYRISSKVNIQSIAVELVTALAGGTFKLLLYSDAKPWPGTLISTVGLTADAKGIKTAAIPSAPGAFWLALHNTSASALGFRSVIETNPYTPGSVDTTAANAFASGIGYNVGSATTPPTWTAGNGTDAVGLELLLRAT